MTDEDLRTNQYGDQRRNAITVALAHQTTKSHAEI